MNRNLHVLKYCRLAIPTFALLVAGCGGSSGMAPVSGSVTYKGKPVAKANVSFTPVEGTGRAAAGFTDDSGRYTLGTLTASDGARAGKYRAAVIARGPDRPPKAGETGSGMPGEMMPGDPVIPTKYFQAETSGLTFEVKRGSNRFDIELKD